jgi:hypothetical protein
MSADTNYWLEPLDPNVIDYGTLSSNHNVYTHLGCVVLRCIIGGLIIFSQSYGNKKIKSMWIVLCAIVVIIFTSKYIAFSASNKVVWKTYLRTIITYSIAGACIYVNKYDHAGLLVIVDALMGLQSRHMAFIASNICAMNTKKWTAWSSSRESIILSRRF